MHRTRQRPTRGKVIFHVVVMLAVLMVSGPLSCAARAGDGGEIWILVDTRALTLSLMRGEEVVGRYDNIAIGSNGATWNKRAGDEKTPRGDFRINEIRTSERFHLFLSLDYPTLEHARRALRDGRLTAAEFDRVRDAGVRGLGPPQNTSLGGFIGIHGLGAGSEEVHRAFNWTNGCVALTNEQVEALATQVKAGTRVRIR